jgi:hypothetical protein
MAPTVFSIGSIGPEGPVARDTLKKDRVGITSLDTEQTQIRTQFSGQYLGGPVQLRFGIEGALKGFMNLV